MMVTSLPLSLYVALHNESAPEDALMLKGATVSVWGDGTSLRKLKSSERREKNEDKPSLFCFYSSLVKNSLELVALWAPSALPSPITASLKTNKSWNVSYLFASHLIIYPVWTAFPITNPMWHVGLGNVEIIFQVQALHWVCSQLLAIQSLFFHW